MKYADPSLTTGLKMISSINYDQVTAITTGSDGAIYVSGYTYGNLDGQTNNGNWDAFITKYLPDGTKSWTNLLGGSDYDQAIAITTGSDGAIYVSGYTGGDMDGQTNNGSADVFITKYLPDGTKSWTNLLGGSEHDQFTSLTTDSDGAIYVSGYTYGDIDGQTNNGGADAFITKYLPDGTKSWTNLFEGSDYNIAAGMTTGGDCATYPSYIDSNLDEETNNGIDDGSNGIDDGSNGIDDGSNGIDDGSNGIDDGLNGIDDGLNGIDDGLNGIDDGSNGIDDGLNGIDDGLNGIDDGLNGIDDGLNGIDDGSNGIDDGLNGIDDGLNGIDDGLNGIDDGLNGIDDGLNGIDDGLNGIDDGLIPKPCECGTITNDDGLITIDDGLITIDDGLITIDDGLIPKPWECGTITNDDGLITIDDGLITIDDGLITIDDGLIPKQWECGTIEWTYLFGGRRDDFTNAITTGSDGAIYISGYSYGDLNVNGQTYSGGYYDAFITKYLPDGTKSWTNLLGSGDYDQITSMKTGSDGAIYVSGNTYGDMDGQTNNGNGDAFITKYLPDGTKSWTNLLGSSDYDQVTAMITGSDGAIYISGSTGGDLDGQTNNGGGDAFITKYLPDGTKSWTNLLGSSDYDQVTAMITGSDGAIYVSGYTYGDLDGQTNNGGGDAFITKYLPDGTKSWTNLLGSSSFDNATALNTDSDGAIYVNGYTYGDMDGQTNNGYYNAFITKYLPDGTKSWTNLLGGSDYDQNTDIQIAICFDYTLYYIERVEGNTSPLGCTYNGGGYNDGGDVILIINDDLPSINLSPNQTVVEGNTSPQSVTYTVTLSNPSTQTITVEYAIANGTAISGLDYTATTGTLTFAPGVTNQSLNIPILNDNLNEADETFTLQLTAPTNAVLGVNSTVSTTITDTLTASVTTILPTNVENLTLTETGAINGTGNADDNIITGNSNDNTLAGLNGNDTYSFVAKTALGTDTIIETTTGGIDTLDFTGTTTAINVNLGVSTLQTVNSNLKLIFSDNNVIENATSGTGNDQITGNILNNTLNGGDGNDQLQGLEGDDSLWGGAGHDILNGGRGNDSLWGELGDDVLTSGSGNDILWGGLGDDILDGGSGNDILWGGLGDDILTGGVGNDKYLFQSSSVFATSLGIDYINDFEVGLDQIVLSKTTFNAITNTVGQALTDFAVVTNDEFVNASNARIVFSQGTGSLFYNQDGNLLGANAVFEFARLDNPDITLSSSDFSLVV
jgi:hypothetical protein